MEHSLYAFLQVCERTAADKKGGHLAMRKQDGQMLLRESAQCADEDEKDFQNTEKHRYFNTNNLWIRLDKLAAVIEKNNGVVPLPMIKNSKTVDPGDADSAKVRPGWPACCAEECCWAPRVGRAENARARLRCSSSRRRWALPSSPSRVPARLSSGGTASRP